MNETERYMYVTLPQIKLKLKKMPIGTIARRYTRPVIGTFFLESSNLVPRAINWVIKDAKPRCHDVRRIAFSLLVFHARNIAVRGHTVGWTRLTLASTFTLRVADCLRKSAGSSSEPSSFFCGESSHLLNRMTEELRAIQVL